MTLSLNLPPEVAGALAQDAHQHGQTLEQAALEALRRAYGADKGTSVNGAVVESVTASPTCALFAAWAEEDRTDDLEEIARRQREGDALLTALRESRFTLEGRTDFAKLLTEDQSGEEAA